MLSNDVWVINHFTTSTNRQDISNCVFLVFKIAMFKFLEGG